MKIEMTRTHQICINKADGHKYVVSEKVNDNEFIMNEIDENGEPAEATKIMNADNAIAFMFISDPNPIGIPEGDYTVSDEMLLCDGEPVTYSMGDIEPVEVIGRIEGCILFLAKGTEKEYAVYGYNPYLDQATDAGFTRFCEVPVKPDLLHTEFFNLLSYLQTEKKTVKEEEEEKEVEILKGYELLLVDRKGLRDTFPFPFVPDTKDVQAVNRSTYIGGEMFETDDDDVILDKKHGYLKIRYGTFDGFTPFEEKAVVTEKPRFGTVYIGDSLMDIGGDIIRTRAVRELKEYPFLVDITYKDDVKTLIFSDNAENQTLKYLECRKTPDRGTVYTIR